MLVETRMELVVSSILKFAVNMKIVCVYIYIYIYISQIVMFFQRNMIIHSLPCGNLTVRYGKWTLSSIVELPIKNGDFHWFSMIFP